MLAVVVQGDCEKTAEFVEEKFPRDHLRDIFSAWTRVHLAEYQVSPAPVTVFITREKYACWVLVARC